MIPIPLPESSSSSSSSSSSTSSSSSSLKEMAESSAVRCVPVAPLSGAAATPVAVAAVPIIVPTDVALRSSIDVACPAAPIESALLLIMTLLLPPLLLTDDAIIHTKILFFRLKYFVFSILFFSFINPPDVRAYAAAAPSIRGGGGHRFRHRRNICLFLTLGGSVSFVLPF